MSEDTTGGGASRSQRADTRRGLLRSIAHSFSGDDYRLPVEGRLGSFDRATGWLNSEPLSPQALRGRVVLVDFWTYTCVNWLRTLPYVRAWADTYEDAGLTVIGVHTPEFGFEKDVDNVVARSRSLNVTYPVAIDSDYGVWDEFANRYWPAIYLADADGRIRYHHFGEGDYGETEMAIQQLLAEAGAHGVDTGMVSVEPRGLEVAADWVTLRSPETYLGHGRSDGFVSEEAAPVGDSSRYAGEGDLSLNTWDLCGLWRVTRDASILEEPGGTVYFRFHARDVNLVMGSSSGEAVPFQVSIDGQPVRAEDAGTDLRPDATGEVSAHDTYQLVRQTGEIRDRLFAIEFLDEGVEAFCFTFG